MLWKERGTRMCTMGQWEAAEVRVPRVTGQLWPDIAGVSGKEEQMENV